MILLLVRDFYLLDKLNYTYLLSIHLLEMSDQHKQSDDDEVWQPMLIEEYFPKPIQQDEDAKVAQNDTEMSN